ncbi:MAG TPA: hypothetical protein VKV23_08590 [Acidimicrobiales bacterium]|nr:hypothetical protein [Acidimicrobiales bacterium]
MTLPAGPPPGALGLGRVGTVECFDPERGLGVVREEASGASFPFHCTEIADGSRQVAARTRVVFQLGARARGRIEARALVPVGPPPASAGPLPAAESGAGGVR